MHIRGSPLVVVPQSNRGHTKTLREGGPGERTSAEGSHPPLGGGEGGGGAAALGIRLRQGTRGHLQDVRCSPPRRHVPEQLQCRADEGRWLGVRWRQAWPAAGGPCMVPAASAYSPCPGPHPTPPLQRQHREAFDRLIEELRYGAIAVNGAIATRAAVGATRRVARKRCPPWPA